jgi:hypothetical protein
MRERDHLEDLGIDVRMILKWILKKWDFSGSAYGQVTRAFESGDEHYCCIKCGKMLDWFRAC